MSGNQATPTKPKTVRIQKHVPRIRDTDFPKSIFESARNAILGDPNKKWGPFAKYVRAAKKQELWEEWAISDVVDAEPYDSDDGLDNILNERSGRRGRSRRAYRMVEEIRQDIRPARIDFADLLGHVSHPSDYSDDFYKRHFRQLYSNTVQFAKKWFDGQLNLSRLEGRNREHNRIWSLELTPQFIEYAGLVAHDDLHFQGWPTTLNDSVHRRWLVVGILAQIMEKKIFNQLFFGADDDIADELERQDLKWIREEGYGRKITRSTIARYGLGGRLLPRKFWPEVDDLTAQSVKVFLPLVNALKAVRDMSSDDFSIGMFTQELHAIMSYAGMLQICMTVSPSIFHILSATPGARMDYSMEQQSDMRLYRESKDHWEEEDKVWANHVNAAMQGQDFDINSDEPIQVPRNQTERRQMEYHRIRGAKVRYAVFPKVTRYRPENVGKGKALTDTSTSRQGISDWEAVQPDTEGQSIIDISPCMVVYYQGLIYPEEGLIDAITLEEHRETLPKDPNGLVGMVGWLLSALFSFARKAFWHIFVISMAVLLVYSLSAGVDYLRHLFLYELVMLLWMGFIVYLLATAYYERKDFLSARLVIAVPALIFYIYGLVYMSGRGDDALTIWDILPSRLGGRTA
ncbi:hypothetical protein F5Y05DRAFT_48122 [Hypoxylon sp. FL0543]|nr:hypothetical protein F5Y05DRAFT_48122 [Hypoxylon sp. FL0543]